MFPTCPPTQRPRGRSRLAPALAAAAAGLAGGLGGTTAAAGPMLPAGDTSLRSDIQYLADHGIITGTVSAWPLAWAPIARDVNAADPTNLPSHLAEVVLRVQARAEQATGEGRLTFSAELAGADNPVRVRGFEDTPRGDVDARAGMDWQQGRFAAEVNVQYVDPVDNPWVDVVQDDDEVRVDDSLLAVTLGNWSVGASTQQRWWGPGWDGSLILSNNARPIPALVIDRVYTDAFATKWLSWIGPWDLNVMFGRLEEERVIPEPHFFGMRFTMRPLQSLEIGISRTAQLCGEGRPCGFDVYWDMLWGDDNIDEDDPTPDPAQSPGNQLGGFDVRWNPAIWDRSMAFYGQAIGEDEAGFFPSRYFGMFGLEWSGYLDNRWSSRFFAEYADVTCEFYKSDDAPNCAYRHGRYRTGYRYKGRVIGHAGESDAAYASVGWTMIDPDATEWRVLLRSGEINDDGPPDQYHTLSPTPQEFASIDVAHARDFSFGRLELGIGYEQLDDVASGEDGDDARVYLQWHSRPGR